PRYLEDHGRHGLGHLAVRVAVDGLHALAVDDHLAAARLSLYVARSTLDRARDEGEPANRAVLDELSARHRALLALEFGDGRRDRSAAPQIHAGDPRSDRRGDVVKAQAVALCHLGSGDLGLALAADDDDLVTDLRVGHLAEVDAGVLEVRPGHDRRNPPAHEHAAGVEPV